LTREKRSWGNPYLGNVEKRHEGITPKREGKEEKDARGERTQGTSSWGDLKNQKRASWRRQNFLGKSINECENLRGRHKGRAIKGESQSERSRITGCIRASA